MLSWINKSSDYINNLVRTVSTTLSNDYNDLDNIPIIRITSTTNNPQNIWELEEGMYLINGVICVDINTSYEVSNLLVSMSAKLENGKYVLSAFIPYLRGLFEYILGSSTEYEQHQKIVLRIKDEVLPLDNEVPYEPMEDYHPSTKKYTDDKVNEIITELDKIGVNEENLTRLKNENRIRDIKIQALLNESSDRNIYMEQDVRYFNMPLSIDEGLVTINEIIGDTLVNVCDQEEKVAITKSYTVENINHIAFEGEYDGKARPVIYGNTLVNHNADWDGIVVAGSEISVEGTEDVVVSGVTGQEVSVVVEGNTVLNHAIGKTSAVVSGIENDVQGNYVDPIVSSDMASVVEVEGKTMVNLVCRQVSASKIADYMGYLLIELSQNTDYTAVVTNPVEMIAWGVYNEDATYTINKYTYDTIFTFNTGDYSIIRLYTRTQTSEGSVDSTGVLNDNWKTSCMIFEGDLTSTPELIPNGYIEGLKSSYECEMITDESDANYGKYPAEVLVTGKNLLNSSTMIDGKYHNHNLTNGMFNIVDNSEYSITELIRVKPNTNYVTNIGTGVFYRFDKTPIIYSDIASDNFTTPSECYYVILISRVHNDKSVMYLEEGTEATSYEPYTSHTKTFYLNSPLLEGDKIVTKNGKVYHWHKMGKVVLDGSEVWSIDTNNVSYIPIDYWNNLLHKPQGVILSDNFCSGSSLADIDNKIVMGNSYVVMINSGKNISEWVSWLQANPTTVVYELANPYYELIDEYSNTIFNISNTVAHLTHTSTVPINNTTFTNYVDELNVLETSTQYRVMFDCDTANVPFTITLGGTSTDVTSIKGTHSLLITTPDELVDKNLVIDGIGRCGIDNIRIFKGDVEYDYVKGLWSGYEERKLENLCEKIKYNSMTGGSCQITNNVVTVTEDLSTYVYHPQVIYKITNNLTLNNIYTIILENNPGNSISIIDLENYKSHSFSRVTRLCYRIKILYNSTILFYYNKCKVGTVFNGCNLVILEGDWTDNPPTYEEVMANEGKYAVKVKLDNPNGYVFGKGGRL